MCRYKDEGRESALGDNEEQLKTLESRKKSRLEERREKEKRVKEIDDDVTKQQMRTRELDDNVKLMEKEKEIRDIETKMKGFKESLNQYSDYEEFQQSRTILQDKIDKYRSKKAETQGRLKGFEDEVKRCNRELSK